ncbi:MAG: hypothetical protein GWP14_07510 [Actinobacteria bacterium]|nr:hypothetical protein [Actinomycetota bacterium]
MAARGFFVVVDWDRTLIGRRSRPFTQLDRPDAFVGRSGVWQELGTEQPWQGGPFREILGYAKPAAGSGELVLYRFAFEIMPSTRLSGGCSVPTPAVFGL